MPLPIIIGAALSYTAPTKVKVDAKRVNARAFFAVPCLFIWVYKVINRAFLLNYYLF